MIPFIGNLCPQFQEDTRPRRPFPDGEATNPLSYLSHRLAASSLAPAPTRLVNLGVAHPLLTALLQCKPRANYTGQAGDLRK